MVKVAETLQTLFCASLTLGVGVWGQIPAKNLSANEEYLCANFHQNQSGSSDFYNGHTDRCTDIQTLPFYRK
jgi:hypothetical protein